MIPVSIVGMAVDAMSRPVVVLKPVSEETGSGRMLPIWIGGLEAAAILAGTDGAPPPRPLTLDLMRSMIQSLGATVEQIAVTKIEDGTFYAEITLDSPAGRLVLDARPSDAIGLSLRTGTTIWVAEEVLDDAGIPDERDAPADQEAEVAAFHEFLENIDPEDFQG